jgi:DMSO/TMAO reductase YedYZ molybdopterin-dependent catalytic subunit
MLQKKPLFLLLLVGLIIVVLISSTIVLVAETSDETTEEVEIREYEGKDLSSINDFYENSIAGPQYIDNETYRLFITGLVDDELTYTYDQVVANYQAFKKVVTLNCVEGWNVTILWEGIRLSDLIADAGVYPNANTMIFYAYDGYSTSLPLSYIIDNNIMIAYKMNNVTLPPERGYPFQLVAESKYGYKWIKWITSIELSDNQEYRGYWESVGYSNTADVGEGFSNFDPSLFNPAIPEYPTWIIAPLVVGMTFIVIIYRKSLTKKG